MALEPVLLPILLINCTDSCRHRCPGVCPGACPVNSEMRCFCPTGELVEKEDVVRPGGKGDCTIVQSRE